MNETTLDRTALGTALDLARQAVATVCQTPIDSVEPRTRPADVKGWDSFGRLQVVLELERLAGRELPLERAVAAESVAALAALMSEVDA